MPSDHDDLLARLDAEAAEYQDWDLPREAAAALRAERERAERAEHQLAAIEPVVNAARAIAARLTHQHKHTSLFAAERQVVEAVALLDVSTPQEDDTDGR